MHQWKIGLRRYRVRACHQNELKCFFGTMGGSGPAGSLSAKGKSLSGEEFLTQHAVPNMYFHVTTAYANLRHKGVPVGKKDFLGELPYRD